MSHRCCTKQKVKRGLWSPEEDEKLTSHITTYGHGSWSSVPKLTGLQRCGKSCRLRWINYLRPDLKKGSFTQEEEQIIIDVHRILGNRWAQIAKHLPGRTDNEVKNFWNSCIKKKLMSQGLDPQTHNLLSSQYNRRSSGNTTTKNKSNNSFVVSHENNANRHEQEPVSAFSMISSSSHHETIITDNICSSDDQDHSTNIPFHLTLPNDVRYRNNIPISTCSSSLILGQNNDHNNLTANNSAFQHYGSISTPNNVSSSSSSSLDVQNIPCLAQRDFGVWGSGFEPFDQTPRAMEVYNNQQSLNGYDNDYDQEQHKDKDKDKIVSSEMQNDRSSSFDLGYLESALMCDIMSHDLSSMEYEDHLSWNY